MVKNLTLLLTGLLISACLAGYTFAQSPEEADAVDIQTLIKTLRGDIDEHKLLIEELSHGAKMEHKALIFRRDERSFNLLADFDMLVAKLTSLPDGSQLRETSGALLTEFSEREELGSRKNQGQVLQSSIYVNAGVLSRANNPSTSTTHLSY